MTNKKYSRRHFIKRNSKALLGASLALCASSSALGNVLFEWKENSVDENEPIIDIHQHIGYSGRSDELLLSHQRAMGISKTILLPAGRSVITASTHFGASNGLDAQAGGNEACYQFAQAHSNEFTFGACEVPDIFMLPLKLKNTSNLEQRLSAS